MNKEDVYCQYCGFKLTMRPIGKFDKKTGVQLEEKVCINEKCQYGCSNTGGHYFGHWVLFNSRCKRCGTDPFWYY